LVDFRLCQFDPPCADGRFRRLAASAWPSDVRQDLPHTCRSQSLSASAQLGGKPPLVQRYRIRPPLSHNPCSGPDRGAGHETPRFYNFTRRRNGWTAIRRACAAEGDAGDRLPRQRLARPESRGLLLISSLYGYCSDFIQLHHFRPSDQGEFEGAGPRRCWANFSARAPARDYGSSGK
jgi:hypothetical protein